MININFSAIPVSVDSETELPTRFKGIAYRGDVIRNWQYPIIIDLESIILDGEVIALAHHKTAERVGKARLSLVGREIHVDGKFSDTAKALEVRGELKSGFDYELSLGVIGEIQDHKGLETVNGMFVTGAKVLRKARVRELSFVTFGAASGTRVMAFVGQFSRFQRLSQQLFNQVSRLSQ